MKKNGFSLVELLAVLVILGLLLVLLVPGYLQVYSSIRRTTLKNKISEINTAALKYGNLRKDDIKDSTCIKTTVAYLIQNGYLVSEDKTKDAIYNPTNGEPLDGYIFICYSSNDLDLVSYYATEYNTSTYYYAGDIVYTDATHFVLFKCNIYTPAGAAGSTLTNTYSTTTSKSTSGNNTTTSTTTFADRNLGQKYFQQITF